MLVKFTDDRQVSSTQVIPLENTSLDFHASNVLNFSVFFFLFCFLPWRSAALWCGNLKHVWGEKFRAGWIYAAIIKTPSDGDERRICLFLERLDLSRATDLRSVVLSVCGGLIGDELALNRCFRREGVRGVNMNRKSSALWINMAVCLRPGWTY